MSEETLTLVMKAIKESKGLLDTHSGVTVGDVMIAYLLSELLIEVRKGVLIRT